MSIQGKLSLISISSGAVKVGNYKVLVELDKEAGGYIVACPALPGCYSQGESVEEALTNIREAIELCLEDLNV